MAAALLCRALHIHRVLVCPTPHLPVAPTHHLLSSTPATTTASRQNAATPIDLSSDESRRHLVNRLVYRSKQRGFLELDLVLGSWVEQHVRAMDEANIRALLEAGLNPRPQDTSGDTLPLRQENPDLWKWLSGQEQPPEDLNSNPVFSATQIEDHRKPNEARFP